MAFLSSTMQLEQAWDQPSPDEESLDLAWLQIQDASAEPTSAVPMETTSGSSSVAGPQEPSSLSSGRKRKINEVEETPEERQRRERRELNWGYKQASRERQRNPVHYLPTNENEQIACLRSPIFQLELQLGFRCQEVQRLRTVVEDLLPCVSPSVRHLAILPDQIA